MVNKTFYLLLILVVIMANVSYGQNYKEVTVPASDTGWYSTGVFFKSGEVLKITADPNFFVYARNGTYSSDPAGLSDIEAPKDSPLPTSPFLSLVGRIGGELFFVGFSFMKNLNVSGELYLSVNDSMSDGTRQDNWGFYKALILQGTGQPPMILNAGFEQSYLTSAEGGKLTIAAEVFDADGIADIESVEILIDSKPSGIKLKPLGNNDMWYIDIIIESGMRGSYFIQLQAVDRSGMKSDIWPYITFH